MQIIPYCSHIAGIYINIHFKIYININIYLYLFYSETLNSFLFNILMVLTFLLNEMSLERTDCLDANI